METMNLLEKNLRLTLKLSRFGILRRQISIRGADAAVVAVDAMAAAEMEVARVAAARADNPDFANTFNLSAFL